MTSHLPSYDDITRYRHMITPTYRHMITSHLSLCDCIYLIAYLWLHPPTIILHPPTIILHPPTIILHPPTIILHPPTIMLGQWPNITLCCPIILLYSSDRITTTILNGVSFFGHDRPDSQRDFIPAAHRATPLDLHVDLTMIRGWSHNDKGLVSQW